MEHSRWSGRTRRNLEQAVIREVKEETCLDVAELTLVDVVDDVKLDDNGKYDITCRY